MGDRLSFICPESDRKNPKLHDDSVVAKLSLRPEMEKVRQTWLRSELAERFPHICRGERDDEFKKSPFALTLEGLVKSDGILREKDDSRFMDDATSWVLGWDVSPKQRTLDDSLIKWREEFDNSGRALREAEAERLSLRSKLRSGAQLQACANEFSDIDQIGLATRIADLEEEERVIVGGSDVLKKLKEDRDSAAEKLEESQNTRDEVLQRIGGVEARAERNETRMGSLRSLLVKSMDEFISQSTGEQNPDEEDRESAEEQREILFKEISKEFGEPSDKQDEIEESARTATHKLDVRINKLESGLDKFRDKNVAAMQRFIADAKNQAFRDEINLDLEEGYNDSTYKSFEEIRRQIEEEDLSKNRIRFEELLRVQVPEEVSGFSEALESHRDRIRKRINELNEHLSRVTFDRKEETYIQLKFEDAGDDGVRKFKKLRRHALEGDLEADDEDERRRERYQELNSF